MEILESKEVKFSRAGVNFSLDEKLINGVKWYIARADQPTPRARYSKSKNIFCYRFKSLEQRFEYVNGYIKKVEERIKRVEDQKAAKRAAMKEFKNPYKVGDVFVNSWGYEQTNVYFYQVVEVKGKSIVWRRIAAGHVEGSGVSHGMADECVPVKDRFIDDAEVKRVGVYMGSDGNLVAYIVAEFGSASLYREGQKCYRSWYA